MTYTDSFYDTIAAGSIASASVVAPLVYEMVNPSTVLDVGCGQGHWGAEFAELGASVQGVDGGYVADCRIPFTAHDLEQPLPDLGQFDLVVSLEVAEHLAEHRAASFVAELCELAPTVLGMPVDVPEPGEYVARGAARQAAWVLSGAQEAPSWPAAREGQTVTVEPAPVAGVREAYRAARVALHGS